MPYWHGIECEGRLVGVPTLFVRNEATVPAAALAPFAHIYLNPPDPVSPAALAAQWALAETLLAQAKLVTVVVALADLDAVPDVVLRYGHLVIDVPLRVRLALDHELRLRYPDRLGLVSLATVRWTATDDPAYAADRPLEAG